ncbi:hypothetical protein AAG747_24800 [Rapidithrix thailandica]|uniref:Glycosyltransferase RgtA/B/C/D-like domain-containing protein n=1 Tax=Rapidithrix thailandica TaxID=413964 RepID=A0AAW9SH84_9BACT
MCNAGLFTLLIFLFYRYTSFSLPKKYFFAGLGIKLLAGTTLGLVYHYYYHEGDTLSLFKDATVLTRVAYQAPFDYLEMLFSNPFEKYPHVYEAIGNLDVRALLMSKMISLANLLTNNNYWLSNLYFSILSFWGIWYLCNKLIQLFSLDRSIVVISFLLYPSVFFWGSGIIKESVLMGCLCFIVGYSLNLLYSPPQKPSRLSQVFDFLLFLFTLFIVFKLKYYYLAILLPTLMSLAISQKLINHHPRLEKYNILLFSSCFGLLVICASFSHPNLHFKVFFEVLVNNYYEMLKQSPKLHNTITYTGLQPNVLSIIQHAPQAMLEGLLRPYLWEEGNVLKKIAAVENLLFGGTFILAIIRVIVKKPKVSPKLQLLIFATLVYSLLMLTLLSLASPNLGNLVRYRVGFMPFLLLLILAILRLKKELPGK